MLGKFWKWSYVPGRDEWVRKVWPAVLMNKMTIYKIIHIGEDAFKKYLLSFGFHLLDRYRPKE